MRPLSPCSNALPMPPARVALYAWHPLPVWEIAGNGHVDAAMIALLMVSLLFFLNGRTLLAGVLATLGALVKPTALLALPVFWRPWDWKLPLAVFATIVVAYLPYLSVGSGVFGFLGTYIEEEGFSEGSGFRLVWLLEQLTGPLPLRRCGLRWPRGACPCILGACRRLPRRSLRPRRDRYVELAADRVPGALHAALSLVFPGPGALSRASPTATAWTAHHSQRRPVLRCIDAGHGCRDTKHASRRSPWRRLPPLPTTCGASRKKSRAPVGETS